MKDKRLTKQTKDKFSVQLQYLKSEFIKDLKQQNYSLNTIDSYKYRIDKFIEYLLKHTDIKHISQLTRIHILDFKDYLFKLNIAPEGVLYRVKLFSKFLIQKNILSENPFSSIIITSTSRPVKVGVRSNESLWERVSKKNEFKLELNSLKNEFLNYLISSGLAKRTIEGYSGQLNYFFHFLLDKIEVISIYELNFKHLREYQNYLCTKAQIKGNLLSLTTQMRRIVSVRKFCEFLMEYEYLPTNISAKLKIPKHSKSLPKGILSLTQISKILSAPNIDSIMGLRDRVILEILYSTGIRNIELRNLKVKDVDVTRCEILIEKGKGGKDRIVPTGEVCSNFIQAYIKYSRPHLIKFNPDTETFIVSKSGKPLCSYDLSKIVKKYSKQAGIKITITPHSLRHTMATHMLKNKAPLRHIQVILGHSSINSTQVYTHVEISDLQRIHKKCHPRGKKQ